MKTQSYIKSYNTIIVCIVMLLPKRPVMDFMGFSSLKTRNKKQDCLKDHAI